MSAPILQALLAHWWRNPLQLVTLMIGLALGTALWSGVQAINAEARASYAAASGSLAEAGFARIMARDGGAIAQSDFIALRRAGWIVSPLLEGDLGGVRLIGLEPLTAPGSISPVRAGQGGDLAAFVLPPGQIFAQATTLARMPHLDAQGIVARDVPAGTAIADIGLAQRLLGREGQIDRLLLAPEQPLTRMPLAAVAPHLIERPPPEDLDLVRLTDSFHLNLTAFGLLSFAVGLFIVHGAIGLAFEQRRPMLRTLRALGAPLTALIGLMAAELAGLALVAGLIGVGLGYVVAAALLPDVAATLRGLYGAEVSGQLGLRVSWWLSGLGMALGGTAIAAAGRLISLAGTPPLAPMQPPGRGLAARGRAQGVAAAALLLLALGLAIWGQGLVAGFAMLAALLMGGALALPPVLAGVLAVAQARARGAVAQWFWADARAQLPGLSLALMALMLAMAANIGVSTMVSSFRLTFGAFLDQRLAAELYVTAQTPAQAAAAVAVAEGMAAAVLPLMSVPRVLAGQPGQVYGARDHATYRQAWRLLRAAPGAWDAVARGEGALINEQLYRRAGLDLGAGLEVAPGVVIPVVGVYGDYGNPIGQAIITEATFLRLFPEAPALRFGLRLDLAQLGAMRAALRDRADLPEDAMIDQAAVKALSRAVFERTFAVTAALNVLTLGVAGLAMLMSLLTLAGMRVAHLAPVWALGLTRRALARLDLGRAVLLAALTAVLALPLGLALAWALLAVVNVEAFGWRLPMYLFPLDYLRLWGLALVAAALAAGWPAWRLARISPARLLRVFGHER